ncbi:zinc-binding dehydrogenase [Aquihabitans sp. G128]|uniref:zinc-binding dehydrogenase n=1 Tax=Aquihabitans sp. G128 TaxID=2849779 RepID=UPI001C230D81|nr:zinc-binding dehydrogenase [Aquihabitans sp. G128]QXC60373.1 zinc-binding dehydrogenase [Aquihabitans sp. G128]
MRRIVCQQWGPPEDLELVEEPDPTPGPGQVVVDVAAAGVNFVDALFVGGTYQIKVPPPFTPGSELAGTVAALGEGVEGLAVGDRVLSSLGLGAWTTHAVVPAAAVTPVPDGLDLATAAALVQSYCTMWFALTRRTTVAAGETVLVLGAAGGVGLAAIDVARSLGARVIAAASSPEKLADATAMGAEATIAYETEDLKVRARELSAGGVDVVVDPVGGPHTDAALRALGVGGRLLVIGFAAGGIPSLPANQVLLNNRSVVGVDWGGLGHARRRGASGAAARGAGGGGRRFAAPLPAHRAAPRRGGRRAAGPARAAPPRQGRPHPRLTAEDRGCAAAPPPSAARSPRRSPRFGVDPAPRAARGRRPGDGAGGEPAPSRQVRASSTHRCGRSARPWTPFARPSTPPRRCRRRPPRRRIDVESPPRTTPATTGVLGAAGRGSAGGGRAGGRGQSSMWSQASGWVPSRSVWP